MRYFKAAQKRSKPFVIWHLWANSIEELELLEDKNSPLILQEIDIPEFVFGVCPLQIIDGELVERSFEEMEQFELEFLQNQTEDIIQLKRKEVEILFFQIEFTKGILEDTKDLQVLYDAKLREYNDLKSPK